MEICNEDVLVKISEDLKIPFFRLLSEEEQCLILPCKEILDYYKLYIPGNSLFAMDPKIPPIANVYMCGWGGGPPLFYTLNLRNGKPTKKSPNQTILRNETVELIRKEYNNSKWKYRPPSGKKLIDQVENNKNFIMNSKKKIIIKKKKIDLVKC